MPVTRAAGFLFVNIFGSLTGPVFYGILSDRIGRRQAFVAFLICQAINAAIYMFVPLSPTIILILGYFLGAFQGGLASGLVPSFSELYPTELRANGSSFCASVGRGVASIVPGMVGILSVQLTLPVAMGCAPSHPTSSASSPRCCCATRQVSTCARSIARARRRQCRLSARQI